MISFQGSYFNGRSSKAYAATVTFSGATLQVRLSDEDPYFIFPVNDCAVMPQIGRSPRTIKLPDGAQIETNDLKAISDLETEIGSNAGMRSVHYLEGRWKAVGAALLGLAVFVWIFISYGFPIVAKKIAYSMSPAITDKVSLQTLEMLDNGLMKPSGLSAGKSGELQALFKKLQTKSGMDYRLVFRKSPALGPNAIALPSGIIIMTDELVKLSRNNRELEGVLLHEMAHVENRHGLRSVIQNAGVYVLIASLAGDITSISSAAGSLPVLLTQSGYSRDFEREADKSAAAYFIEKGWSLKPYQDILLRITKEAPDHPVNSLLSSHPVTNERVKYLQEYEKSKSGKKRSQ